MERPSALSVEHLRVELGGVTVVDGVSLDVSPGEAVVLLGPSGCGKTTFLRTVAGLERPASGRVRVGDDVLVDDSTFVPAERRRVGLVFQDWALFPHLTVEGNVGFGLPRAERRGPAVAQLLDLVGLGGLGNRRPATLSGGQQQRVALARALATRPRVLLLDEPFSNLDSSLRHVVRSEVSQLLAELGTTSVIVTHDQEEAFVLGNRVAVMRHGRVTQVASPAELYRAPADRWTARFVGSGTMVPGRVRGGVAESPFGSVPLVAPVRDGAVDLWMRPEQLVLRTGTPGASPLANSTVESVEFRGPDTVVVVGSGNLRVAVRVAGPSDVTVGDPVAVEAAGDPVCAFVPEPEVVPDAPRDSGRVRPSGATGRRSPASPR